MWKEFVQMWNLGMVNFDIFFLFLFFYFFFGGGGKICAQILHFYSLNV